MEDSVVLLTAQILFVVTCALMLAATAVRVLRKKRMRWWVGFSLGLATFLLAFFGMGGYAVSVWPYQIAESEIDKLGYYFLIPIAMFLGSVAMWDAQKDRPRRKTTA